MSQPMISVCGVSKRYRLGTIGMTSLREELERFWRRRPKSELASGEFWALKDVTFDVQQGDVLGLIGRNGAGKSTLLKVLSRITEPSSGEICLRGRVGSLLEVGTGFHPELSGRDNIFLNGTILGMNQAEIRSKFDAIVDFAEVEKFIDTPVKRYSSGMYVRLAFAVAAHLEPEILIVDEVLAVGDQQFQEKCFGKMKEISSGHGRTIIFVSHHMAAIRRLCQKCVVMTGGISSPVIPAEEGIRLYTSTIGESEYNIDVSDFPRDGTAEGRVCKIVRAVSGPLSFGLPLDIDLTVECFQPIKQAMIGLGFNSLDGSRILTLDSDANGEVFHLQKGTHTVRLHLDSMPLHPGYYQCSAAIGFGNHFFDILGNFATWQVKTSPLDHMSDRGNAGCRLPAKVTLTS
jgi:lipopolysaccharide transport system ATP-binding protein